MDTQDFTTDPQMSFMLLLKEAGAIPSWLDQIPEPEDVAKLPNVAFADTFERKMPLHTKAAAFMSAVSVGVYGYPESPSWMNRLKAACVSYGITDEVEKAHAVLAPESYHKAAAEGNQKKAWALELVPTPGAAPSRYYPINNPDEIEDSALKLASDMFKEKLPGTWFAEAADNLIKAADAHGLSRTRLPATVLALGEDRLPSPEYLQEQIERRVKQASLGSEVEEIYKEAAEMAISGDASPLDAAHVWEMADRKFGIRLTDTVASPVASFRSGMTRDSFHKLAGQIVPIAGIHVPFNQLKLLSDPLVAAALPMKVAAVVLQAKQQEDGLKAAAFIQELDEPQQLQILEFMTETASA